jgi:hypothetical protein
MIIYLNFLVKVRYGSPIDIFKLHSCFLFPGEKRYCNYPKNSKCQ